ncbi:hypothetical protein G647_09313 [Cladophialophora carrionii CBS 160.54]|uniref:Enoyl reductase (ER) domain-containing protein n=1 Tax=Cladophialophora carrionii CBS 160.54 TaxID=1279043 RepID=V9CXY2_9EURO|nr:uncharacterized protein G647_09313 [Cladophialophora carrionii CBS 160.54]ETI19479.1 hypothetical protein G647_09313 [Cladophialophora carrionii CBS 160.54]
MSSTHQAAVLPGKGEHLIVQDVETPKPGPRELLISVHAIALNPVDFFMRDLGFMVTAYPAILGSDIAGTVEALGSDIPASSPFKPGAHVLGFAPAFVQGGKPKYGGFQKKVVLPIEWACPIPPTLPFTSAATLPMAVLTAWTGFTTIGIPMTTTSLYSTPHEGDSGSEGAKPGLLVWGASSSVGMSAIQVATHLGFPAIYATSRPQHHAQLLALGAARAFDYTSADVVEEIIAAANSDTVALTTAYRAIGDLQPVVDVVATFGGGKVASAPQVNENTSQHETVKVKFVMGPQEPTAVARHLEFVLHEWLAPRLQAGTFVPAPKARVVDGGLGAVDAALDILKGGVSGEKLVLEVVERDARR